MAEPEPNSSFQDKTIRVGTKPTRIRWGIGRPQHGTVITTGAEESHVDLTHNQSNELTAAQDQTIQTPKTSLSELETDQLEAQTSLEVETNPEQLPPITLEAPIAFAGKIYSTVSATDHVVDKRLAGIYEKGIAGSMWADEHMFNKKNTVVPASFSTPRPRIFAVLRTNNGLTQMNIKWMTEGDYIMERGIENNFMGSRIFPNTEARIIDQAQMVNLSALGYDIWSALTNTENINWVLDDKGRSRVINMNGRTIKNGVETISIGGSETSLWNDKQWLENDQLVASIADAYLAITKGKFVKMTKPDADDPMQSVLVAQALSQMTSARERKLIYWVTEPDVLDSARFHLTFIDGNSLRYPQKDDVLVNLKKSQITPENKLTVNGIREAFSKPLPEALKIWGNIGK